MRKTLSLIAAITASLHGFAQDSMTLPEVNTGSYTLTSSVVTEYMFRGARLGGPSFQPAVEYNAGDLGLGVWANIPLKDKVPGQSDPELDFYGFYSMETTGGLTIAPGFTIYTYPNAKKRDGYYKATYEPSIAFSRALGSLQITLRLYYDSVLKGPTAELSAGFAVPIKELGTELDFTGTLGTFKWTDYAAEAKPTVKNWGDYYLIGVAAPFQISVRSKVTLGWSYSKGSNNYLKAGQAGRLPNPAAVGRGIVTLSYAFTF